MLPPLTLAALAQAGSYQIKSTNTVKKLFQDHSHRRSEQRKQARGNSKLPEAEIQYYEQKLGKTAQKREKESKQELSYLYRQLIGKLNQQEIDAKLKEIITWDQDSWPTQFNLSETKLILRNHRDRLLILASSPKISLDKSLGTLRELDFEVEMRIIGDFLNHHYPTNHPQRPVKFYSDYFTKPIYDLDVELLHPLLTPLPTYIIYSDVKAQVVTFRVSFWGIEKVEVDPFPILEWHWSEAKEKLTAAGEEGWNLIRQLIIIIHQLLTAFLADLYYLGFDPNYQPQFLYLKSELDLFGAAFNPYINLLQELQEQQLETYEEELVQLLPPPLPEFSFETVTISQGGLNRRKGQAQYFTVDLGKVVTLDMVAIPGGEFLMGSSEDEEKRSPNEGPQHWVKVPPFFMSKYPVTQAQWEAVMGNNSSRWREPNLPVERVSWSDSVKFCYQLTQKTKKQFRLATEAEWEYAARAGITTPFHFGGTITTDFANYNGNYAYGFGYKGVYRQKTTVVSSFPPNSFGLYDMHGNVWEWCYDVWHDNYINAPKNGWPWEEGWEDSGNRYRVLRGGSWDNDPGACRSAIRSHKLVHKSNKFIGLRIVCLKKHNSSYVQLATFGS